MTFTPKYVIIYACKTSLRFHGYVKTKEAALAVARHCNRQLRKISKITMRKEKNYEKTAFDHHGFCDALARFM